MPDYMYMLESRLSPEQRAALMRVQELAVEESLNVYLTGGAVRDVISGAPIRDLDFTVEGNPSRLARELEKGGAKIVSEDEKLREVEVVFSGDVDGSISAAREEVYARPGSRPEIRWSSIMEDLRRRDFSLNAIAISLNAASRGLLLDPTNGLADLESREVRALSIHSFTNEPVRLLRVVRYVARMDFRMEGRTEEWFALALERQMEDAIPPGAIGAELRQASQEEAPGAILKAWEARGLIGLFHPQLERRHPDYELLARVLRARDDLRASGLRPRLAAAVTYAALGRLKARERAATLDRLEFRAAERQAVADLEKDAQQMVKMLAGRKTAQPRDAFAFLEKAPGQLMAFVLAESSNSKAVGKIRNYLQKWRPLWQGLPAAAADLEKLGMARGPKFDKVIEGLFQQQLLGKGRSPEDRVKVLRKLAGIKEEPKKKLKEEKKKPQEKPKNVVAVAASAAPAVGPKPTSASPKALAAQKKPGNAAARPAAKRGGSSAPNKAARRKR